MHLKLVTAAFLSCCLSLPALAAITGIVMTSDGQPIAGARVSIYAPESDEARLVRLLSASAEAVPIASTQSDAKGSFSLDSPKEPVVSLRVSARGYEPNDRAVEGDEEAGAIALTKAEMKTGKVTAGGKGVAGATVAIYYGNSEYLAKTDEQGRYDAPDIKRVRQLVVIHPDYAIDEETFLMPMGGRPPASEMNRALTAGAPLSGRVVAADGKTPIAKATVFVDDWPLATSGDDGAFTIAHAAAKWSMLVARKDALIGQRSFSADKAPTIRVEKGATISGRVTNAKTKVPIAGVSVTLGGRSFATISRGRGRSVTTDAKGSYSIIAPAAAYSLLAAHPAYDMENLDVSPTAGQQVSRDVSLKPRARVSGVIVDEEKRPVAAAVVTSENANRSMGFSMRMMRDSRNGISGPDGRFSMRLQPDEDLRLKATKKGLPPATSDLMKLASGERKSGVVLTIPSGVAVTGRVTNATGEPLSGVTVTAAEAPAGGGGMRRMIVMGMIGSDEDAVRSASDGTFALRVKEGTYDFTFRREGYAPKYVRAQSIAASATNVIETSLEPAVEVSGRVTRAGVGIEGVNLFTFGAGESSAVTGPDGSFTLGGLSPGQIRVSLRKEDDFIQEMRSYNAPAHDVVIDLPVGGTISGRVVEKGTRKPIPSFQAGVSPSRSSGGMVMMSPPQLRNFTSDDGSFALENVPIGAVNLVAIAPGFASGRLNLDVQEGKSITDVALELDAGVRLHGKVTGPNGAPLSDVSVQVTPSATGAFARTGSLPRTSTDENGEYSLESMESGEETVEFSHPKQVGTTKTVTLKGRETRLDVQLSSGLRVTGVVETDAGMPLADAEVRAYAPGGSSRSARTDGGGAFVLESVAPARYRFSASKSGFAEGVLEDVDVSSGAPVRIVVRSGGTIYGRVIGLEERELSQVMVTARSGMSGASAAVDPAGNFKIEGAPIGTVQVAASMQSPSFIGGRTSPTQTVEVAAGSAQQVNIEFRSDTAIRGRVTRNGMPLAGATVMFYSISSRSQSSASVSTDEGGQYTVPGLEPGEYSVNVMDLQRFSPYSTKYEVRGSGTFDIDFKTGSVRGRVIDATTNEPVSDASVQFRAASSDTRMVRSSATDTTGAFSIDFVPPGPYVITASKDGFGNQVLETNIGEAGRDDIELRLARNDGVTLRVVDGRDGRTLNATAIVFDGQGRIVFDSRMAMRFSEGGSDLRLPLGPGSYTATISAFGYAWRTATFTSPSTPTIALTPGGTIVVQSRHSQRRRMRLLDASGTFYPRTGPTPIPWDLPAGSIPLEHIAPGTYTLQLLGDDQSVTDSVQVVVREGETVTVSL